MYLVLLRKLIKTKARLLFLFASFEKAKRGPPSSYLVVLRMLMEGNKAHPFSYLVSLRKLKEGVA